MAIADEYATADAGMTNPIRVDEARRVVTDSPATRKGRAEAQEGGKSSRRDSDTTGKRKATDDRVESKVVATTEIYTRTYTLSLHDALPISAIAISSAMVFGLFLRSRCLSSVPSQIGRAHV